MKHFSIPAKIKTLLVKKKKGPSVLNKPKLLYCQAVLWGVQVEPEKDMIENTIVPLLKKQKKSAFLLSRPEKAVLPSAPTLSQLVL